MLAVFSPLFAVDLVALLFAVYGYRRTRSRWPRAGAIWLVYSLCVGGALVGLAVLTAGYGTTGVAISVVAAVALWCWRLAVYNPVARRYGDDLLR